MVKEAIRETGSRKGASSVAIIKYIAENFPVNGNFKPWVHLALRRGVRDGEITQSKLHFKLLNETASTPKKSSPRKSTSQHSVTKVKKEKQVNKEKMEKKEKKVKKEKKEKKEKKVKQISKKEKQEGKKKKARKTKKGRKRKGSIHRNT